MSRSAKISTVVVLLIISGLGLGAIFFYSGLIPGVNLVRQSPVDLAGEIEDKSKDGGAESSETPLDFAGGFEISVYAKDLPGARVIMFDPAGNMLVSLTKEGRVMALYDKDKDGKAEEMKVVVDRLSRPHGLAFRCEEADVRKCRLYIAEEREVAVYDYDPALSMASNRKKILDLPGGAGHFTRTLLIAAIGGKERLLVSIGSSCNVCLENDERRAAVYSAGLDGSDFRPFARGLRNSVFMAENPSDGKVWATEMGRDLLGDNLPPDEINIIEEGKNYGWPLCYGKNIHDTAFDKNVYIRDPCDGLTTVPSHIDLPAHTAPLGIAFFPGQGWPQEYWNDALVAMHGSWNSSVPVGYKIVRIKMDEDGGFLGIEDFITGWLTSDNRKIGRPVGMIIRPGGLIYFSDDESGAVYELKYKIALK